MFRLNHRNLRFIVDPIDAEAAGGSTPDPETPPVEPSADAEPAAEEKPEGEEKPPLSREDLEAALAETRREAAGYRTRLREAEERLGKAKTPEEFTAAVQEFQEKHRALEQELTRTKVATAHNLPNDLAALLKGETEDELKAHAKVLAKYAAPAVGVPAGDLGGGLDPSDTTGDLESLTPAELAKRVNVRGR